MSELWRENFVSYANLENCYIYCDTNASYASIHQYLEDGQGQPCVVANGSLREEGDAGACLAISYEARARGIGRGCSLRKAKGMFSNLVVYESCLPLYELYADLYDMVLEWIVPRSMCYRGSCDEVIVHFNAKKLPYGSFTSATQRVHNFIREREGQKLQLRIEPEQRQDIEDSPLLFQSIYAICYLIRDAIKQFLGLPISIAVAPSVSLAKALVDQAKPIVVGGRWSYHTLHDAIAFPKSAEEANHFLRRVQLRDLCGVRTIAKRLEDQGLSLVGEVQDHSGLDRTLRLARNPHLGKVLWYSCHGRDDVLPGYLAAIRERR